MDPIVTKIIFSIGTGVWLCICILIYRRSRDAAWLAGSTVTSCLFFLGVTICASAFVQGALFLTPLWLGVFILSLLHLGVARRRNVQATNTLPSDITGSEDPNAYI
jgi:hypothetical protein